MRTLLFLITGICFSAHVSAQHPEYARKVINDLCSEDFAGRGYVKEGAEKAATYIAAEYKKAGLQFYGTDYFQPLGYPVIAYPYEVSIKLDETEMIPGDEFIVSPGCPAVNGVFSVLYMDSEAIDNTLRFNEFIKSPFSRSFIIVDVPSSVKLLYPERLEQIRNNPYKARGVIYYNQPKLTWGVAVDYDAFPKIYMLSGVYKYIPKKITVQIVPEIRSYNGKNVIGFFKGSKQPDSVIVFSAHYDHLGMMGTWAIFPGGNDNASGVAMMLDLMNYYKEHPPLYTVCFIGFTGEEAGLFGSYYYTEHPLFPLSQISMLINLDLMGTGDKGMTVVNATLFPKEFQDLQMINLNNNYLPVIASRGKAQNSDHYFFSEHGVKAFFFYLMGEYHAYHDVQDNADAVTLSRYSDAFRLIRDFADGYQRQ
jgi:hypothetical protein